MVFAWYVISMVLKPHLKQQYLKICSERRGDAKNKNCNNGNYCNPESDSVNH
jgi:hypothetical protein